MSTPTSQSAPRFFASSEGAPAVLGLEPADGGLIGVEGQGRTRGCGQVGIATQGRAGELGVVGDDHQRLEVDHVERVVGQQSVEGFCVAALIIVPKQYGEEAVDVL